MTDFFEYFWMSQEEKAKKEFSPHCDNCGKEHCFTKYDLGFGHTYRGFCSLRCKKVYLLKTDPKLPYYEIPNIRLFYRLFKGNENLCS